MEIMAADAEDFLLLGDGSERRRRQGSPSREGRTAGIGTSASARAVAASGCNRESCPTDRAQHLVAVGDPVADDVDDIALLLEPSAHGDHRRGHDLAPVYLELVRPEDAVRNTGLVLDRDEQHALGAARLLADEDDARYLDVPAVLRRREVGAADDAPGGEFVAQERDRVRPE